jgi:hypothetical protein
VLQTLPFPLAGTTGGDGARRASHASPTRTPAPVLRGVGIATVAAIAVTGGAAALSGPGVPDAAADGTAELNLAAQRAPVVPVPSRVAAFVPAPVVPMQRAVDTGMLDTTLLSDAVSRAQDEARRLADGARTREAEARTAADRAQQAAKDAASAEEDRRTAEQGRRVGRITQPDPKPAATADCGLNTGQLGAVKPFVRTAAEFLGCAFDKPTVLGVAGRGNASDHPGGRALDFMVDRATGDQLAACTIRNREALGVSYVIWRQRIDTGSGFRAMEDRGSPTANHLDHVHVSFKPGAAGTGSPISC